MAAAVLTSIRSGFGAPGSRRSGGRDPRRWRSASAGWRRRCGRRTPGRAGSGSCGPPAPIRGRRPGCPSTARRRRRSGRPRRPGGRSGPGCAGHWFPARWCRRYGRRASRPGGRCGDSGRNRPTDWCSPGPSGAGRRTTGSACWRPRRRPGRAAGPRCSSASPTALRPSRAGRGPRTEPWRRPGRRRWCGSRRSRGRRPGRRSRRSPRRAGRDVRRPGRLPAGCAGGRRSRSACRRSVDRRRGRQPAGPRAVGRPGRRSRR